MEYRLMAKTKNSDAQTDGQTDGLYDFNIKRIKPMTEHFVFVINIWTVKANINHMVSHRHI